MWSGLGAFASKSIQNKYYFIPRLLLVKAEEGGYYYSSNVKKIKSQMKNTKNVEFRRHSKLVVALNWNRTALERKYLCQTQIYLAVKRTVRESLTGHNPLQRVINVLGNIHIIAEWDVTVLSQRLILIYVSISWAFMRTLYKFVKVKLSLCYEILNLCVSCCTCALARKSWEHKVLLPVFNYFKKTNLYAKKGWLVEFFNFVIIIIIIIKNGFHFFP